MKDGIAGGMSNFQNSSFCWLYFFFQQMFYVSPHCDKSLLWKELVRPQSPGHSTIGNGFNSAMPELRAESQPFAPSPELGAVGHMLAVGLITPHCTFSPQLVLSQLCTVLSWCCSAVPVAVEASCRAWAPSSLACGREHGWAMGTAGNTQHQAGRVPSRAQGGHVGLPWCWVVQQGCSSPSRILLENCIGVSQAVN